MRSSILSRRSPRRATRADGFSLVELIVSIVVLGILAAVTAPIFSSSLRTYVESDAHLATMSKARYTIERIARELREVQYNSGTSSFAFGAMGAGNTTFTKWDGTTVTLSTAGSKFNMRYAPPGVTAPLTDELSALALRYLDASGNPGATAATVASVEATLTLFSHGATYTQRVRVGLRNQS